MNERSDSGNGFTRGIVSRENQKRAVRLLSEVLREPLKDIVKEAVEEFESETESNGADGGSSLDQFILLALLGAVAAAYLANRRSDGPTYEAAESSGGYGTEQRDEGHGEEIAAGVGPSGSPTTNTETSGGSGSRDETSEREGDETDGED